MGYRIAYRKSPRDPVEYHHERERHLASRAADAILLEGYELLEIQSTAEAYPLTMAQVFARREAKATCCRMAGTNQYAGEDAWAVERFRAVHPSA